MNFNYSFIPTGRVDIGRKRPSNQDTIIMLPSIGFFAVSDGMGGLINGGETSQLIQTSLCEVMKNVSVKYGNNLSADKAKKVLVSEIESMAKQIADKGAEYGNGRFGATLCGVWLVSDKAIFFNIGDSRGYIFRSTNKNKNKKLVQVTKDQNLAAYLVERGELTKEEARNHPSSAQLLKYVGMTPPPSPVISTKKLISDCELLLCSDGLYGMMPNAEIARLLVSDNGNKVDKLIDAANANGGKDNISVIHIVIKE